MTSIRPSEAPHARSFALPALRLPTVALILAPLAAMTVALVQPVDFDYWWHRRTGELIAHDRIFPRTDPFAFTTDGKAWIDHEWLAQLVFYGVDSTLGYLALFAACFALGVAAWWLVRRTLLAEGVAPTQALLLSLAPLVFGAMHWRARPAMFTLFFFALVLHELFAARRGERRSIWHLALIMPLWANLHGGYVIGLALIAIFAVAQRVDGRVPGATWRHACAVLAAGFVLTVLNPYTWRLWLYPLTYFMGENESLRRIDEWQSPDFHQIRSMPLAALLLLTIVTGVAGRRLDAWRTALLVVFGAMALQSMRHQTLFALAWAPCVAPALVERWAWWRREDVGSPGVPSFNYALLAGGAAALLMVVLVSPSGLPLRSAPVAGSMPFPEASAAYVAREHPGARIFNEYGWGGFLIERLYPTNQVYIDGRADLHGALVEEYQRVIRGDGWREAFARHGITVAIVPPSLPLVRELRGAGWTVGYANAHEAALISPGRSPQD
jgi:hypothetical protein